MKTRVVLGTLGTCAALLGPRAPPLRRTRIIRSDTEEPMLAGVKGPTNVEVEGLPWWWEYFWKLPITQRGNPGDPLNMGDTMHVFRGNIEQIYGDFPSVDGAPLAEGDISGLSDGTMYLGLDAYAKEFGPTYKLCFGPKSFIVIADPIVARHVLRDNAVNYNKGVLAEILEDIMGKGLIPADPETWRVRRRAIVPGFHAAWLEHMVGMFGECSERLVDDLDRAAASGASTDLEERFGSLALDIIGKAVFNYDFGSVKDESPVVRAAIATLREAEHRSMTPAPYWKLPLADVVVPRQAAFKKNMALLNGELQRCIEEALSNRDEADIAELENRDYSKMANPSLLRFMVDMRGEETTSTQLRDDLMTMLIAGHETTASALTWAVFELAQHPQLLKEVQDEVDRELGDRVPSMDDLEKLELVRLCVAESLRMYPEPPLLIRRALDEDQLPSDTSGTSARLLRASDVFIAVYSIHRSPLYWENPDEFDPHRFKRPFHNPDIPQWKGFDPEKWAGQWYPNEVAADFAYLPFGGGPRKCVGDKFALLEATVALAMVLRRYDFSFAAPTEEPSKVGTNTGATIHTRNGLYMTLKRRHGQAPVSS